MFIIKSNQKKIEETVQSLYDAAISYYGTQFQDAIKKTIETTIIYDMKMKSLKQSIQEILGEKIEIQIPYIKEISSFFLVDSSNYQRYVLCRGNQSLKVLKNNLAHELYGHALFGVHHFLLRKGTSLYMRNGFTLKNLETNEELYPMWTEGCAVLAQEELLRRNGTPFQIAPSYKVAYQGAKFLREVVGEEALNEQLIHGSGTVVSTFNEKLSPIFPDAFQKIEKLSMLHSEVCLSKQYEPNCYQNQMNEIVNQYRKL